MRILTVTNLYPRPDQPQRGLFNAQLFRALAALTGDRSQASGVSNVCLVPEWRRWRWGAIRRWEDPFGPGLNTRYVPVFYVPVVGRNLSWRFYRAALQAHRDLFAKCDAVLATWLYPDAVAAANVARRHGKPVWIKVHGTDRFHLAHRGRRRRILATCDAAAGIVCNCRFVADELAGLGVDAGKIHVVPNGVDAERFRYRSREEAGQAPVIRRHLTALGCSDKTRIVLFVGNLAPVKGPDVMLAAWQVLTTDDGQRTTDCRLLIIGDGRLRGALERQARRLGIADSVIFLGSRPQEEVALWMNAADCLCLTSRSEGMPNVVSEALAAGLPVAATDAGACGELLAGEPAARVVGIGADLPARMARALSEILTVAVDRRWMAERHAGRCAWSRSAAQVLALTGDSRREAPHGR
jgi:glycosyltransferase involved in cell wall biosynthesis